MAHLFTHNPKVLHMMEYDSSSTYQFFSSIFPVHNAQALLIFGISKCLQGAIPNICQYTKLIIYDLFLANSFLSFYVDVSIVFHALF